MCVSLCSNNICGQLKPDRNSTADVFDSDKRVVLQTARDASWQDPLTRLGLSVTPQDEQPGTPNAIQDRQWRRMRKGTFHQLRAGVERARIVAHHCIHPSRVRSGLRMTRTAPVDPLSHSVGSRVKPLFIAWTFSMDSIVPAVFSTGAECVKWSADFGLSVTSRLLDSLMKFLRAGRSVRLWINRDANTPDYKRPISQTIASVLMRRRSLQLLSRLRRFRSFPGFCAVWTSDADSRMLQSKHHPEILEFQRLLPHRISIQNGKSSLFALPSHQQLLRPRQREAVRSAMTVRRRQISSRACRPANCVSKAVIDYLVQQKVPETLVSEIVRPSPEAAELLSVSAPVAAAATRVSVGPSGDVVMTPTDQAQRDEDANLRKIVAQLHVNLGHPGDGALARAIRLSGGCDDAIQAAFKVRCTVCERLIEPSPVPAASLRRWTEFGQCVALDLFTFVDITGENGLFLNLLDMASHYQVVFPVANKNPLTVFY